MGMRSVREVCIRAETVLEILCCGFWNATKRPCYGTPSRALYTTGRKRTPYNTPKDGRPLYHWRGRRVLFDLPLLVALVVLSLTFLLLWGFLWVALVHPRRAGLFLSTAATTSSIAAGAQLEKIESEGQLRAR